MFRYSSEGKSRLLFYSTDVPTLRKLYPERAILLQEMSEDARLIVSEPLGDVAGAGNEMPEATSGVAVVATTNAAHSARLVRQRHQPCVAAKCNLTGAPIFLLPTGRPINNHTVEVSLVGRHSSVWTGRSLILFSSPVEDAWISRVRQSSNEANTWLRTLANCEITRNSP